MNGPRIQSDERGLTINKSLAWTILVGLITGSIWVGAQIQYTKSALDAINRVQESQLVETRSFRTTTDSRIRALESFRASDGTEITALRRDLTSFRDELKETTRLLQILLTKYERTP